jgi:glutathione synthase/RimK-type ligase-like ATP-grasp enzyme
MVNNVALVTYSGCPELTDDDRLLIPALRRLGVDATPVAWDETIEWGWFNRVILRSCWDYHLRSIEFLEWITNLERLGVSLHNSASLVRWNADKRYLRELQDAGARIPPTVWIDDEEEVDVQSILKANGWDSAVVKPTVSASAHRLKRVFKSEPAVRFNGPAMAQLFIPEVLSLGEWSLVFICGEYSHSVVKAPAPGDFRVQWQFGGTAKAGAPSRHVIDTAKKTVDALPQQPLYARVDGIEDELGFILMEVELIEPVLFLGLGSASDRFAEKIVSSGDDRYASKT